MSTVADDAPFGGSPFPPIAEYGFLSDCETCALVAPSCERGVVVPAALRFAERVRRDARPATRAAFRLAPADVDVPAARRYLPGTNVLETSWGTSNGWIIVRDVLLIGPWHHEHERSHTHRRAPTDSTEPTTCCCAPCGCVNGEVQVMLNCEPVFDYGGLTAEVVVLGPRDITRRSRATTGSGSRSSFFHGHERGLRGAARDGPDPDEGGGQPVRRPRPGPRTRPPRPTRKPMTASCGTAHYWQHWLDHGVFPDHPWRGVMAAVGVDVEGVVVCADGGVGGCCFDVVAGVAWWGAELGLSVYVDSGRDFYVVGFVYVGV